MTHAVTAGRAAVRAGQVSDLVGLTMTSGRAGAVHSVLLTGELDLANAEAVEHELLGVEAGDAGSIVLDLSGLTFMDSSGIRLLVHAAARSSAGSGRLTLIRGGEAVERVLQITALDDILPFAD
jgi:anti-anti-sigma factor